MNVNQHKSAFLDNKTQVVILDDRGRCIESCDTLFPISIYGEHTLEGLAFLESVWEMVLTSEANNPLEYSCIRLDFDQQTKYFDMSFTKKVNDEKMTFVWALTDFTSHYTSLISIQQERNESDIKGEFLELEQKNILLQKQLLEFKNKELNRHKAFKERFYANLSHELRTPVNGIVGLTELLKSKPGGRKELEYLTAIEATGQHLVSIVNDVLDLSKIDSGKLKLKQEEFDIRDVIKTVLNSFQPISDEKSLELGLNIDSGVPYKVLGDKTRFIQVLYNVVGNAMKFTNKGGVSLSLSIIDIKESIATVNLDISDTGIGISPAQLKTIFEPFEQVDTDVAQAGTGLGLSIVKNLVELMGGKVQVKSTLGKGTKFSIRLSVRIVSTSPPNTFSPFPKEKLLVGKKILIVDDDLTSLLVLKDFLTAKGAVVMTISDASKVVDVLSSKLFDLMLLDYHMPGISVEELLESIDEKVLNMNRSVATIILTGNTDEKLADTLINAGVTDVLHKPFVPHELLDTISKTIEVFDQCALQNISIDDIDLRYLSRIMGDDQRKIIAVVNTFCNTMPENIEELINAFSKDDIKQVTSLAHKAKSGCAYIGLHKFQRILNNLETDALNGIGLELYESLLPLLQNGMTRIISDLKIRYRSEKR